MLHRYRALKRWHDGKQVYDFARQLFPNVLPISEILDRARRLMDQYPSMMSRDAVHAAVVLHEGLDSICSYDRDFDRIKEITRTQP